MSTPGWYDDGTGRQRWWDGQQWGPFADAVPARGTGVGLAPRPRGLAIAALVVGIVAFLAGWVPVLGLILGAVAALLGIIALAKKQPKGLGVTGLVLGAIAVIVSLAMTIGFSTFLASRDPEPRPVASSAPVESPAPADTGEEAEAPVEEQPAPPAIDLAAFQTLEDRDFALIAKDPDSYSGQNIILYGSIMQFDSATGRCAMIISTAATQKEMSFDYEQNVMAVSGDENTECPVFDPLVENDHVKLWVTIEQSFSYDTQIGGNTTVPLVTVWQAELLPATEY